MTSNTEKKPVVLLEKDAIKEDQDGIKKSLNGLDARIHGNAVQCMLHAEKHGDTSLMRRLLIDIVDAKSGYRRQGLINWMRKHSPMELKGDVITLQGIDAKGNKRPFNVEKANETPFWNDSDNREMVVRPVFQQGVVQKFNSGISEFEKAVNNTVNGKPVDASKPFYDGKDVDKVKATMDQIKALIATLPEDSTREVRQAQQQLRQLAGNSTDAREMLKEALSEPHNEVMDKTTVDGKLDESRVA